MTPDNSSNLPHAGVLRRFAALTYDALLILAISICYGALATGMNVLIQGQPPQGEKVQWGHWGMVVFIGWLMTVMLFYCFFWRKSGQTLGMRAWRMQLRAFDLQLPNLKQCLIRCAIGPVSLLCGGLGYFWLWIDADHLTLHDRLSKTRVVVLPQDKK